jgi:hypothetical protein
VARHDVVTGRGRDRHAARRHLDRFRARRERLRPLGNVAVSLLVLLVGVGMSVDALTTGRELSDHGVVAAATVVVSHQGSGRYDASYLRVRIDGRPGTVEVTDFDGYPRVGERIQLRYLTDDPETNAEVGSEGWRFDLGFGLVLGAGGTAAVAVCSVRLAARRRSSARTLPQHRRFAG